MKLIYFILCCYGLTNILVYGRVFEKVRPRHHFFHCPMCVGFWVGVFLTGISPLTGLFTYEVSLINAFLMGALGSGTSYSLCMLISDGGLQHEHRVREHVDTKMDAQTSSQVLQG